jgi:hypothetical protein
MIKINENGKVDEREIYFAQYWTKNIEWDKKNIDESIVVKYIAPPLLVPLLLW